MTLPEAREFSIEIVSKDPKLHYLVRDDDMPQILRGWRWTQVGKLHTVVASKHKVVLIDTSTPKYKVLKVYTTKGITCAASTRHTLYVGTVKGLVHEISLNSGKVTIYDDEKSVIAMASTPDDIFIQYSGEIKRNNTSFMTFDRSAEMSPMYYDPETDTHLFTISTTQRNNNNNGTGDKKTQKWFMVKEL